MSPRFDILATPLPGLQRIQRRPVSDERGFFERLYCTQEMAAFLSGRGIAQINRSLTRHAGAVRGMHYQRPPHAETKIVSCLRGAAFDVAVDLRRGSSTFLHWHGEIISADNHASLLIPEGFAHGFQALTDDCEMLYLHTTAYEPAAESGLNPQDPTLAIRWPLPIGEMSPRDAAHAAITDGFEGLAP
ncbi:MAG TPA: dTDP-4-dehydrorhamnose 3,5-epimerase family protein [Arenimonas sp.]|uniref:dTDP-4-dehydrorhamnose 3,5-epimerase family protein n=1 Tax=Arenimonas sp. TaxID=1872635 RepID=UPI002C4F3DA5|nr:dTDP-4-dehydrorhamnose 3,5-epimerase family protein [Arenimonas sp.]HMB56355.1 dTDP-4-dehydrorhamnose 3,5-epimerase family protein [Arenimonas sp.]